MRFLYEVFLIRSQTLARLQKRQRENDAIQIGGRHRVSESPGRLDLSQDRYKARRFTF